MFTLSFVVRLGSPAPIQGTWHDIQVETTQGTRHVRPKTVAMDG